MGEVKWLVCEDDGSGVRHVMAGEAAHAATRYAAEVWSDAEEDDGHVEPGSTLDIAVHRSEVTTHWKVTRRVVGGMAVEIAEPAP